MAIELATQQDKVRGLLDELEAAERHCRRFPTMESILRVQAASKAVHEAYAATGKSDCRGPRLVLGNVVRSDQHNVSWQIESAFEAERRPW